MADPLSIAASIIAVVTLAREVTTSIDAFLSSYRAADSELKIIAQEVEDLHNVLKILHEKSAAEPQVPRSELSTADQVLLGVLKDLGGCVTELDVVVKKSCERMGKGGVHKLRVQVIWQSTSKGIEKIRISLSRHKMTLMLLLQVKTQGASATPETIRSVIEVAIQKSLAYENEIEAGDKRIREIRRYLDETENIPRLANSQIGSPDTVQSYPSFDAWIDSFAGSDEQIEEDQVLMERYKVARIGNQPETQRHTSSSAVSKMMVHLIVTDLTKEADSAQHVEQMFFPLDTEIREILGELKRKGYSSVTGLRTQGVSGSAVLGPVIPLSQAMPAMITNEASCYNLTNGLAINQDENFLTFYSKVARHLRADHAQLDISYRLDGVKIHNHITNDKIGIRFCKTVRVPEANLVHDVPATMGFAPIVDVAKCDPTKVPPRMKRKGGLLIPLLQREALALTFCAPPSSSYREYGPLPTTCSDVQPCQFGMRLYSGEVNVISGLDPCDEDNEQNHYVVPLQERIDGFGGRGGKNVKQFVAMPLGSKYTLERQLLKRSLGGLQIEIAPRRMLNVSFQQTGWTRSSFEDSQWLTQSARKMGMIPGQTIRMVDKARSFSDKPVYQPKWKWKASSFRALCAEDWSLWMDPPSELDNMSFASDWHRSRFIAQMARPPSKYPDTARPATLFDLFDAAGLSTSGALVVSAIPPISVNLQFVDYCLENSDSHTYARNYYSSNWIDYSHPPTSARSIIYTTTLTVSPFELMSVFRSRLDHACTLRAHSSPYRSWEIANLPLTSDGAEGIHKLGIIDGFTIEVRGEEALIGCSGPTMNAPPFREGWEMSTACGSDLRQNVKPDPKPEYYWDWDASRVINIQILNTVAFESLTGLTPPASPLSWSEYSKAGIAPASYYLTTERSGNEMGNFPEIRTVGEIDAMLDIQVGVRLSVEGKPAGCFVCERNICDAVLEPCHHAFCTTCIKTQMQTPVAQSTQTTCILCSVPSTQTIISSAPMELPPPKKTTKSWLDHIASEADQRSPKNTLLSLGEETVDMMLSLDSNTRFMLQQYAYSGMSADLARKVREEVGGMGGGGWGRERGYVQSLLAQYLPPPPPMLMRGGGDVRNSALQHMPPPPPRR